MIAGVDSGGFSLGIGLKSRCGTVGRFRADGRQTGSWSSSEAQRRILTKSLLPGGAQPRPVSGLWRVPSEGAEETLVAEALELKVHGRAIVNEGIYFAVERSRDPQGGSHPLNDMLPTLMIDDLGGSPVTDVNLFSLRMMGPAALREWV